MNEKKDKNKTMTFKGFFVSFFVGTIIMVSSIIYNGDLVFSVVYAIIYYTLLNMIIRSTRFANDDEKNRTSDILDSSLISMSALYILKKSLNICIDFKNPDDILMAFLLYSFTLFMFVEILVVFIALGLDRYTHWKNEI